MQNLNLENYKQIFVALDFEVLDTGGGCTAWQKDLPNDYYLLITNTDGNNFVLDEENLILSLYNKEDMDKMEYQEIPFSEFEDLYIQYSNKAIQND